MYKGLFIDADVRDRSMGWTRIATVLSADDPTWYVDPVDIPYETGLHEGYFSTEELLAALKGNQAILAARMFSVPKGQTLDREIIMADDYFKSNCESAILCYDVGYFEVFSKRYELLLTLSKAFKENETERMEWLDDSEDVRTDFRV